MPDFTFRRLWQRGQHVALNALLTLLVPLTNIGCSIYIVRHSGEAVWGAFVDPLLLVGIAVHLLAWGNKEYLLRTFSLRPDSIIQVFRRVLLSRAVLIFIVLPVLLLANWDWESTLFLFLWIIGGFLRQSLDVLVVFQRDFGKAILVDLLGTGVLFAGLLFDPIGPTTAGLVKYFALAALVRGILLAALYAKPYLVGAYPGIQFQYFALSLPFFLLGFAGMVSMRTDLLCVAFWMDDASAGRYQIFMNFFLWAQAGAGFLLLPFAKNLYRLPRRSFQKLTRRSTFAGLGIAAVSVPAIWFLLEQLFELHFDWPYFALGTAFLLPIYCYTVFIYWLYKKGRQQQVLLANVGGILLNLGLNMVLIPEWGLLGALLGSAAAQWFILGMVAWYARR